MPDEFDNFDYSVLSEPGIHALPGGGFAGFVPLSSLPEPIVDSGGDGYVPIDTGPEPDYGAVEDSGAEEPGTGDDGQTPSLSTHPPEPPKPAETEDEMPSVDPSIIPQEILEALEARHANESEPDPSRGTGDPVKSSDVHDEQ